MRWHFMRRTMPRLVALEGQRVGEHLEHHALLFGVVYFLGPSGKLLARAAIDERHGLRPSLSAVRAESMATLPPPITRHFCRGPPAYRIRESGRPSSGCCG